MPDLPLLTERRVVIQTTQGEILYRNFDARFELEMLRVALDCTGWKVLASVKNVRVKS